MKGREEQNATLSTLVDTVFSPPLPLAVKINFITLGRKLCDEIILLKMRTKRESEKNFKDSTSFWFLNINIPIFLLKPCSNGLRKSWFKFLGASPSKC